MIREIGTRARPEVEALARRPGLPRARRQGPAALATRPEDARAARAVTRPALAAPRPLRPRRSGRRAFGRPSSQSSGIESRSSTKSRPAIASTRSGVAATTRGGARRAREQRDLADVAPGAQPGDASAATADVDLAFDDDVELRARLALRISALPCVEVALDGEAAMPAQVALRAQLEQREVADQLDLGVGPEQHGRALRRMRL